VKVIIEKISLENSTLQGRRNREKSNFAVHGKARSLGSGTGLPVGPRGKFPVEGLGQISPEAETLTAVHFFPDPSRAIVEPEKPF